MSFRCGCCEGTTVGVPAELARRPGLTSLRHRVGVHATFLETMLARLSRWPVDRPPGEIESWLVTRTDIGDATGLTGFLSTTTDPAAAFVWDSFDADSRAILDDDGTTDDVATDTLVDQLNRLAAGPSIHTTRRFASRVLDRYAADLIADQDRTGPETVQLNRLLLEAALRRWLRPIRTIRPLDRLTTRDPGDFSIALLDGWAVVADIVSFYQGRLVDEGYLRTADDRRSIRELARLVGYEPRPGVAASTYVSFELQPGHEVEIPAGTLVRSTPAPGGLPQSFETSEPLLARAEWGRLAARLRRPQRITAANVASIDRVYMAGTATGLARNDVLLFAFGPSTQALRWVRAIEPDESADRTLVWLQTGIDVPPEHGLLASVMRVRADHADLQASGLANGATARDVLAGLDRLVAVDAAELGPATRALVDEVTRLHADAVERGHVRLAPWLAGVRDGLVQAMSTRRSFGTTAPSSRASAIAVHDGVGLANGISAIDTFREFGLGGSLTAPRTLQPANPSRLARNLSDALGESSDLRTRLLTQLQPAYAGVLYAALAGVSVRPDEVADVFAFRVRSALYGHNAPRLPRADGDIDDETGIVLRVDDPAVDEDPTVVDLAQPVRDIVPGSWIVVRSTVRGDDDGDGRSERIALAGDPDPSVSRADYDVSSAVTRIRLLDPVHPVEPVSWFDGEIDFSTIRTTHVLAQAERLELAEEPILADDQPPGGRDLRPIAGDTIELDALHDGLEPGRWIVVEGERSDIAHVDGVIAAELAMISDVAHAADPTLPGDTLHTTLTLAGTGADGTPGLSYSYRRDTVRVHANVVAATHGETVEQVLGSGDAIRPFQRFELKRPPLTHVAGPIPAGAAPELDVRVNSTRWHRADSLVDAGQRDRAYVVVTGDDAVTEVVFGDGANGARPPTGAENVSAEYRTGIGLAGNVDARTIDTLIDKPLGVTEVVNPIAASGGADPESREMARSNAPLAVTALDRLVSVVDYADFARMYAGIVKADARLLALGRRQIVHLTVALAGDGRLDPDGDLARNLRQALTDFADPRLQLVIAERQVRLVVLSAKVRISADERWESIEPTIRTALGAALGFERRELGVGMAASEVIAAIQGVCGVEFVDLDQLDWVDEERLTSKPSDEPSGLAPRRPSFTHPQTVIPASPAHVDPATGLIVPARLAYADASSADAVVLEEQER